MRKSNAMLFAVLFVAFASVNAETRIWTDEKGNTIEAEHVRTLSDKVVLRKSDGSELRVSLDTLSERDRRYAILLTPPRMELHVSANTERENEGYGRNVGGGFQVQTETVEVGVRVEKTSSQPYEAPLRAELRVIGRPEQEKGFLILEQASAKFRFNAESEHAFSAKPVSLKQVESGRQRGVEYEGYVVAVYDKTGEVLPLENNKAEFEKNAEAILASESGTRFDLDFNRLAEGKSAPEPRVPKRKFPGRRF